MHTATGPLSSSQSTRPTTTRCGQSSQSKPSLLRTHQKAAPKRSDAVKAEGLGVMAAQTAVVAAAAWLAANASKNMEVEQDRLETMSSRRPCPSCSGTGYEACMCTRWSDGDVGCNSCAHTGMMKCRSCGGGGTAVPIKVTIRKNDL